MQNERTRGVHCLQLLAFAMKVNLLGVFIHLNGLGANSNNYRCFLYGRRKFGFYLFSKADCFAVCPAVQCPPSVVGPGVGRMVIKSGRDGIRLSQGASINVNVSNVPIQAVNNR